MAIEHISPQSSPTKDSQWYTHAMEHLINIVQDLSHTHTVDEIAVIVRSAARNLIGADGATFILRDEDKCYYADEDAISPLWKGQRFPMENCISGWVMLNKKPAVIEDIYQDPRIPVDAYRPTFVKSLAVVPIRQQQPIGAIGTYWARRYMPTPEELSVLQALADMTSVAMKNAELYKQLREKIEALEKSNYELSRFAWSASHDLKSPLRAIDHLSQWIEEDLGDKLQGEAKEHMHTLRGRARRMEKLLDDILDYSTLENKLNNNQGQVIFGREMMKNITSLLHIPKGFEVTASEAFQKLEAKTMPLQQILYNLIGNAVKHHHRNDGSVSVAIEERPLEFVFTVTDDGPGIDPIYHEKIFEMFQTLKPRDVTEGSGMGLALVKKILSLCNGTIMLDCPKGKGCIFSFTLPRDVVLRN